MSWEKITEQQNSASINIDMNSTSGILSIINNEDAGVPSAIQKKLPLIKAFIDVLVPKIQNGGRLFYIGTGTSGRLGVLDAAECPPTFSTNPDMVQGIIAGGYDALVKSVEGAGGEVRHGLALGCCAVPNFVPHHRLTRRLTEWRP